MILLFFLSLLGFDFEIFVFAGGADATWGKIERSTGISFKFTCWLGPLKLCASKIGYESEMDDLIQQICAIQKHISA